MPEIEFRKYVVRLSVEERRRLEAIIHKGTHPSAEVLKAQILLKADVSGAREGWNDTRVVAAFATSLTTIHRMRQRLVEEGFDAVLQRKQRERPSIARIFDGETEVRLITLACSAHARWSLRLLEKKVVELGIVERASDNTIGRTLKKTFSNRT
jgi:Homeodomain-like domain